MRGYLSPYNDCLAFFSIALSLSTSCSVSILLRFLLMLFVCVSGKPTRTYKTYVAKNVHMAMHTYIHVYVFTSIPMYVCFLTYEAGIILTSKVVKPHTCVHVYECAYGMYASM